MKTPNLFRHGSPFTLAQRRRLALHLNALQAARTIPGPGSPGYPLLPRYRVSGIFGGLHTVTDAELLKDGQNPAHYQPLATPGALPGHRNPPPPPAKRISVTPLPDGPDGQPRAWVTIEPDEMPPPEWKRTAVIVLAVFGAGFILGQLYNAFSPWLP